MRLKDVAMIAADTTRTFYYIKELIRNNLQPAHVFLLFSNNNQLLPGQNHIQSKDKLLETLEGSNISFEICPSNNINDIEVVELIKKRKEAVFIFSGFGGVLLRKNILATGKKFLHVHGGYLPDYKGSTTNYFSLIHESTIGASAIFLTKDIDCGPVLLRKKFAPPVERAEIDHVYDSKVRAKVLIETLNNYVTDQKFNFELENNIGGETYYIIHPVLKHLAILGD
tara:strand:- start:316 stop:993 length:678 start_codon:yes stop_codon:yes gene_type:complete